MNTRIHNFAERTGNAPVVLAVRDAFRMLMPILIIGSFAFVAEYFPIERYTEFIGSALNGAVSEFLQLIYRSTTGLLSIYVAFAVSFAYMRNLKRENAGVPFIAAACFFIMAHSYDMEGLGTNGVFLAIVTSLISTRLVVYLYDMRRSVRKMHFDGANVGFADVISLLVPAIAVIGLFTLTDVALSHLFGGTTVYALTVAVYGKIFTHFGNSFISAFTICVCSNVLWVFGIHGGNAFEPVVQEFFAPAVDVNHALAAAGQMPSEIFTKQFMDMFVLMGGGGTTICLILAVLLFSKRSHSRNLCRLASGTVLFNVNEIVIFGYPIIFDPTMAIPFITVSMAAFITSYAAMRIGLVPLTVNEVNRTVPVLLSGYMATGSIRASILQLFNIALGTLIYRPFVLRRDAIADERAMHAYETAVEMVKKSEETLTPITLTHTEGRVGSVARELSIDLYKALKRENLKLIYQPQFNAEKKYSGAEALMRWKHPLYGMVYPPLLVQLAEEGGFLMQLEEYILEHSAYAGDIIRTIPKADAMGKISVNVTGKTVLKDDYFDMLTKLTRRNSFRKNAICIEITEQSPLLANENTRKRLNSIRDLGYRLAIDDFTMGHTSVKYLQKVRFDVVKLDGSIIRGIPSNPRNIDIIRSICVLSKSLNFEIVAEYVETDEQLKILSDAGVTKFQGYLYSKPMPLDDMITMVKKEQAKAAETK